MRSDVWWGYAGRRERRPVPWDWWGMRVVEGADTYRGIGWVLRTTRMWSFFGVFISVCADIICDGDTSVLIQDVAAV